MNIKAPKELPDILARLSQIPTEHEGRITWDASKVDAETYKLVCSIRFSPEVDDYIKDDAIWFAVNECARKRQFSQAAFIQALRERVISYEQTDSADYIAISQINHVRSLRKNLSVSSAEGSILLSNSGNRNARKALSRLSIHERSRYLPHDDFIVASTKITAPNDRKAVQEGHANLKFGFGLLNLIYGGYGVSRRFGYPSAPIGQFQSASSTIVFKAGSGTLGGYTSDNYFPHIYKQSFTARHELDKEGAEISRRYSKRLKVIDFREKLVQTVILFQEGLEAVDIDVALLKLWTGIELIGSRGNDKRNVDGVIERVSSIFTDPGLVASRLRYIQEYRHKIVHKGSSGHHAILCAQWASTILAEIIRFCLFNKHGITSHDDMIAYMTTPLDIIKIRSQMKVLRLRLGMLAKDKN